MGKHIIIKHVRCSFPQLYTTEVKEGGQTFNPGITVLLDPDEHGAELAEVEKAILDIIAENPKLKKSPPKGEKLCLRNAESDGWREEYPAGNFFLKAGSKRPPLVLDRDMTRMTEATDKIYSGCYVNVKIELWGQANQYGRRVNAKLLAVQFNADGESFDGSYVSEETAAEGFGSIDDAPNEAAGVVGGGLFD